VAPTHVVEWRVFHRQGADASLYRIQFFVVMNIR
jgi:hypothetical protein